MALNLGTTTHIAKKRHRCENCGQSIMPGQVYVRARVVDGGDAWVWKSHDHCQKASQIMFDLGVEGDEGMLPLVSDFDRDDRAHITEVAPEIASEIWPASEGGADHG